ncbi:hypothetical protein F6X40_27805 [Paraburkholderia sp. UCT31]|uniref:hypothetical protein n=1 Tax=Paraburkholderia sp. UCT31 TaxID=2615209 RepID=UPI00165614FE|nr:hypothetical protein [Paraburkholderia sp. UCT31]MBC8740445.1 hypothetical protein [Paraburkholderia sp. UCT31]
MPQHTADSDIRSVLEDTYALLRRVGDLYTLGYNVALSDKDKPDASDMTREEYQAAATHLSARVALIQGRCLALLRPDDVGASAVPIFVPVDERLPTEPMDVRVKRHATNVLNPMHPGFGMDVWEEDTRYEVTESGHSFFTCDVMSTGLVTHWAAVPTTPAACDAGAPVTPPDDTYDALRTSLRYAIGGTWGHDENTVVGGKGLLVSVSGGMSYDDVVNTAQYIAQACPEVISGLLNDRDALAEDLQAANLRANACSHMHRAAEEDARQLREQLGAVHKVHPRPLQKDERNSV